MNQPKEVIMEVPFSLRQLILANNELLRNYQATLVRQVEIANEQMMQILRLDPSIGWRLDMERMVYVRTETPSVSTNEQGELNLSGENC